MTFVDHKNLKRYGTAQPKQRNRHQKTFNDYGNNNMKPDIKEPAGLQPKLSTSNDPDLPAKETNHLFDFLTTDKRGDSLIEVLGGSLHEAQSEDYEKQDFAYDE